MVALSSGCSRLGTKSMRACEGISSRAIEAFGAPLGVMSVAPTKTCGLTFPVPHRRKVIWTPSLLAGRTWHGFRSGDLSCMVCLPRRHAPCLHRDAREAPARRAEPRPRRIVPNSDRHFRALARRPLLLDEELRSIPVPAAGGRRQRSALDRYTEEGRDLCSDSDPASDGGADRR